MKYFVFKIHQIGHMSFYITISQENLTIYFIKIFIKSKLSKLSKLSLMRSIVFFIKLNEFSFLTHIDP